MKLYKALAITGMTVTTLSVLGEVVKQKNVLKKVTKALVNKQPEIKDEFLNDYLDKKVINIRLNGLNDFRDGEVLKFKNVVLHKSVITDSHIESDGLFVIGSNNMLSNNMLATKSQVNQ